MNSKARFILAHYDRSISLKRSSALNTRSNDFIGSYIERVTSVVSVRGDVGVAGEGRVVGVPNFHSWGKCTMPFTNIKSDWMSNASSGLRVILCYTIILYYNYLYEQSNRTPRCSREVSAAGLPWLERFRVQCYT